MTIDAGVPGPGDPDYDNPDLVDPDLVESNPGHSGPVESPCIRLCTLDDQDVCLGCFRSMAEICAWSTTSNNQRQQVLIAGELRRAASRQRA
jgi:predicted Fe-S protein YdhL (DUF1289 family)